MSAGRDAESSLRRLKETRCLPDNLNRDGRRLVNRMGSHRFRSMFSAIRAPRGLDVVEVSRRLGHDAPAVTLTVYAHLFEKADTMAASAIDAALTKGSKT